MTPLRIADRGSRIVRRVIPQFVIALLLACQPAQRRALILDLALSDPALIAGTAEPWTAAGYAVDYRRGYPHLTRADLERYRTVVLLGGRRPEHPSDAVDAGDLALLTEWIPRGGVLVLGYAGDGEGYTDRRTANRWLAALDAGIRIGDYALEDSTVAAAGGGFEPQPLATLGRGPLRVPGLGAFVAGRSHVLVVASPWQVLARTSPQAFVRPRDDAPQPRSGVAVVAAARIGDGLVVVASRHLLGVLGPELRAATVAPAAREAGVAAREFLMALARWTRRPAEWAGVRAARDVPLVAVADTPQALASRVPPREPPAGVATVPFPLAPPEPDTVTVPGWIRRQGLRIAVVHTPLARGDVGLHAQAAALDSLLAFLDDGAFNVLAAPVAAPLLADTGRAAARRPDFVTLAWRQAAERMAATSVRWYATLPLDAVGPDDAGPCLLDERRWTEGVRPLLRALAAAARDHRDAIAGVAVELASPPRAPSLSGLTCDTDYAAALTVLGRDSAWTARWLAVPPDARYAALLAEGLLPAYLDALERALAARAAAAGDDARRTYPAIQFALYARDPLADWRAFGLARGLATGGGMVQLWDGELASAEIVAAHARRGTAVVHAVGLAATRVPSRVWPRLRAGVFDDNDGFWVGPLDAVLAGAPHTMPADSLSRLIRRLARDR
jgi:hypothetical protein